MKWCGDWAIRMKSAGGVACGLFPLLLVLGQAEGQSLQSSTAGADSFIVAPKPEAESDLHMKSENTALMLSLAGTVVPAAVSAPAAFGDEENVGAAWVFLGALLLGPSVGHFYSDRPGRALAGIGIRGVAMVGLGGAIAASWDSENSDADALAVASLGLGAACIAYDIVRAPHSARVQNNMVRQSKVTASMGTRTRSPSLGMCVEMRF